MDDLQKYEQQIQEYEINWQSIADILSYRFQVLAKDARRTKRLLQSPITFMHEDAKKNQKNVKLDMTTGLTLQAGEEICMALARESLKMTGKEIPTIESNPVFQKVYAEVSKKYPVIDKNFLLNRIKYYAARDIYVGVTPAELIAQERELALDETSPVKSLVSDIKARCFKLCDIEDEMR